MRELKARPSGVNEWNEGWFESPSIVRLRDFLVFGSGSDQNSKLWRSSRDFHGTLSLARNRPTGVEYKVRKVRRLLCIVRIARAAPVSARQTGLQRGWGADEAASESRRLVLHSNH